MTCSRETLSKKVSAYGLLPQKWCQKEMKQIAYVRKLNANTIKK